MSCLSHIVSLSRSSMLIFIISVCQVLRSFFRVRHWRSILTLYLLLFTFPRLFVLYFPIGLLRHFILIILSDQLSLIAFRKGVRVRFVLYSFQLTNKFCCALCAQICVQFHIPLRYPLNKARFLYTLLNGNFIDLHSFIYHHIMRILV